MTFAHVAVCPELTELCIFMIGCKTVQTILLLISVNFRLEGVLYNIFLQPKYIEDCKKAMSTISPKHHHPRKRNSIHYNGARALQTEQRRSPPLHRRILPLLAGQNCREMGRKKFVLTCLLVSNVDENR